MVYGLIERCVADTEDDHASNTLNFIAIRMIASLYKTEHTLHGLSTTTLLDYVTSTLSSLTRSLEYFLIITRSSWVLKHLVVSPPPSLMKLSARKTCWEPSECTPATLKLCGWKPSKCTAPWNLPRWYSNKWG